MRVIYYICFFIPILGFSQTNWEIAKNKEEIQIWVRNYKDSPYKEYKATTQIKTSLKKVIQELLEAPTYTENCEDGVSHLIYIDNMEYFFYVRNEFPWPIKDRDVVSKLTIENISSDKVKLHIEAAYDALPIVKGTLRIQDLSGYWLLEEKDDTVTITQQLYINPEGSLPPFIVNSLLVTGPFKTFLALKKTLHNIHS